MRRFISLLSMAWLSFTCYAQSIDDSFDDDFSNFVKEINEDYSKFISEIKQKYIEFVRHPWKEFEAEVPIAKPKEDSVPPVIMPKKDRDTPITPKPVVIDEVVKPEPIMDRPEPVEPIINTPIESPQTLKVPFYGNIASVRYDKSKGVTLNSLSESKIADALKQICSANSENLVYDCLKLRDEWKLSDWAYLMLLRKVSDEACGVGTNSAELLMAYAFMQSGYIMRMATDGRKLYMLYGSQNILYNKTYYTFGNYHYYSLLNLPDNIKICQASYPKERSMSLLIDQQPVLNKKLSVVRTVKSKAYPNIVVTSTINKNLLDFYATYPTSFYNDNMMTRWAMYANTPASSEMKKNLYSQLQQHVSGLSEKEAVERILNLIQTGFEYGYDDKVWGGDRAFFPDETLYYPYCDCEDRAILMSRIVRDIVGLKCILVFYPGHLAMAVGFNENVVGDYILLDGQKYVICDPTYIGAPIGWTMTGMDNNKAKVIILQ